MVLIHGLGEHSGRYSTDFASFYTKSGIAIIAPDLPGHGMTKGVRGHISDPKFFLAHLDDFIQEAKERFPNRPVFLYGHSMGGEITLWYTLECHPDVNGVIVTSPGIGTKNPVPPVKLLLAKIMSSLMPAFRMDNGLALDQLSRDKKVVEAYISDPLVHKLVSAKLGLMIINQGKWILAHAAENKNKMLVMIGSKEGIVNKDAVDQFCKIAPNVEYKVWPGLFHEIHNEPEKKEVFDFTLTWLLKSM